jgi:septal ring factor EnvC (AmiA/AmiB activator)
MIEASITLAIACVAGLATVSNRINNRISDMDKRLDTFELRVADQYAKRSELAASLQKFEDHMIRIESKIDQLTLKRL